MRRNRPVLAQDEDETERQKAALEDELRQVEEGLRGVDERTRRLWDVYTSDYRMSKAEYDRRRAALEGERQLLENRRKELQASLAALGGPKIDAQAVRGYFAYVEAGLRLPRPKLRESLQSFGKTVKSSSRPEYRLLCQTPH